MYTAIYLLNIDKMISYTSDMTKPICKKENGIIPFKLKTFTNLIV